MHISELAEMLKMDAYPRASAYDPHWALDNLMGPNVLWLTEALTQHMDLKPGMRVLDMGCGKAISSIFLAKELGVQVWATDLWIEANENWERVKAAGVEHLVYPIHAEAHSLPYADGFFDAAVSMDAYHYFGTSDIYMGWYFAKLIKPGGQIGIIVPGLRDEFEAGVPAELVPYWEWDFSTFHSPLWWRKNWESCQMVKIEYADFLPDGWKDWLKWLEVCKASGYSYPPKEAEMLSVDAGRHLGFTRLIARRL
jgi:SAM-dependent methyltransferase